MFNKKTKGYISILAVLVLLAVTGSVATALTFSSIDGIKSTEALRQGEQALLFSESCLEEGLVQIIRNPEYAGNTFNTPLGSCEVAVEKNGEVYTVQAMGRSTQFERSVAAEATLSETALQVASWKEE